MFRFTIRELVLLTIIIALVVGWWLDRSRFESDKLDLRSFMYSEMDRVEREVNAGWRETLTPQMENTKTSPEEN